MIATAAMRTIACSSMRWPIADPPSSLRAHAEARHTSCAAGVAGGRLLRERLQHRIDRQCRWRSRRRPQRRRSRCDWVRSGMRSAAASDAAAPRVYSAIERRAGPVQRLERLQHARQRRRHLPARVVDAHARRSARRRSDGGGGAAVARPAHRRHALHRRSSSAAHAADEYVGSAPRRLAACQGRCSRRMPPTDCRARPGAREISTYCRGASAPARVLASVPRHASAASIRPFDARERATARRDVGAPHRELPPGVLGGLDGRAQRLGDRVEPARGVEADRVGHAPFARVLKRSSASSSAWQLRGDPLGRRRAGSTRSRTAYRAAARATAPPRPSHSRRHCGMPRRAASSADRAARRAHAIAPARSRARTSSAPRRGAR